MWDGYVEARYHRYLGNVGIDRRISFRSTWAGRYCAEEAGKAQIALAHCIRLYATLPCLSRKQGLSVGQWDGRDRERFMGNTQRGRRQEQKGKVTGGEARWVLRMP